MKLSKNICYKILNEIPEKKKKIKRNFDYMQY